MKMNTQFQKIPQSATVAAADRVRELKAQNRKITPLQVGDPDFSTPEAIVEVAVNALRGGYTHYCPSRGLLELRNAVAEKIAKRSGFQNNNSLPYDPDTEILVTHGGVHAYYLAMQSILNPGDEVLIPDPSWVTHKNMVRVLRGDVVPVPAPIENGSLPAIDTWRNALSEKSKAIVINYPANPTGAYPSREYLIRLLEFARENDLWVISDEVYENLYYGEEPISVAEFPDMKDHVILINSLSKTYAMTGWRVGYIVAPSKVIENALKAGQNSITCVAPFVQKAAAFALSDEKVQVEAAEMRSTYAKRRNLVLRIYREYKQTPVNLYPPMGAFYFFLDFRKLQMPSVEISERILNEAGVGLVPGIAFGEQGEGFVRMTIAASDADVEEGFRAIMDWAGKK